MPAVEHLEVPQAHFAGPAFWKKVARIVDAAGHRGHALMLVGQPDPTDRYELRCQTCSAPVVEVLVKREEVPA